ncbi:MAG: flagellar motor protein MotB, partial [Nitrospinota bacterium]
MRTPLFKTVLLRTALFPLLVSAVSCAGPRIQKPDAGPEERWETAFQDLKAYTADLEAENTSLRKQVSSLEVEVQKVRARGAREASADLERASEELRATIRRLGRNTAGGVEYVEGPDGPVIRITDRLLFASGSAEVSSEGRKLLEALSGELLRMGGMVQVEGHSDNDPIRVHAEDFPHGNLQLSAERAVGVAALLIDSGLPPEKVSAVGYGEWRPLVPNDSAEGKARNRRVEIVVRSETG